MPSIVDCFQNHCKTARSHSSNSVVEADLPDIFSRYILIYLHSFHNLSSFALLEFIAKQQKFMKIILADLSHLSNLIYLNRFIASEFIVFLSSDKACHLY